MREKIVLKEPSQGIAVTLVFFALIEALFRVVYLMRNSTVNETPLPYVIGNDYGPGSPRVDGFRIQQKNDTLIWKNRPNLPRRYLDTFSPVRVPEERSSLLLQFLLILPDSLRDYPLWAVSPNLEGSGMRNFAGKNHHLPCGG